MEKAMKNRIATFIVVVATCWSTCAVAQAGGGSWEDLSQCKLPNGIAILPSDGTLLARKEGSIFSFATEKLSSRPEKKEKWSAKDFIQAIRQTKAGDIMYFTAEGGGFFVVSGRIADLGKHYLCEFSMKELPRPKVSFGKEERRSTPGIIEGIRKSNGHCYLIETADRKYVIFRLITQESRSARIQWVYQSDGTRRFTIPKGKIVAEDKSSAIPLRPKAKVPSGLSIVALNIRDFAKAVAVHRINRSQLVKLCTDLLASKDADLANRQLACVLLGELRATEGAPVLASVIDLDLALKSLEITPGNNYKCVQALISIGIPGAEAAISQIEADSKAEPPKEDRAGLWKHKMGLRRNLLALVVLKVYGEKLAKAVLEDRIKEAKDPKAKEAFKKALESFPRIRNWLPENKARNK